MKLQKLVYYTYGWWLAYNDQPLINEKPEVWRYGPVFESLYRTFRTFGSSRIKEPVSTPFNNPARIPDDDEVPIKWVDWIWQKYGNLSAVRLSEMTHEVGSPWQIEAAAQGYRVGFSHEIPDEITKQYFRRLAADLN
jgi:uncharacterized phage-associated protein